MNMYEGLSYKIEEPHDGVCVVEFSVQGSRVL